MTITRRPAFPQLISPAVERLIAGGSKAAARQFLIAPEEEDIRPDDLADPIGDAAHSPLPGLVRRHADRVLLKPLMACAVHCRFCFRREALGGEESLSQEELAAAMAYIAREKEIFEVILTGGDPLMLPPARLREIVAGLDAIPHLQTLRMHTRLPVAAPERLDDARIDALRSEKPFFIVLHCNHPDELTAEAASAIGRLDQAGFPLLSQSVLLAGVNDDPRTLADLCRSLIRLKVKPYYLHQCDKARGNAHFRVPLARGQAIIKELRGMISGIAMPAYVLDIPGGHGKVPVGPSHLEKDGTVRGPDGRRHPA